MNLLQGVGLNFWSTFEISRKSLNPYTAKYLLAFILCLTGDNFELWRHKSQWDDERRQAESIF